MSLSDKGHWTNQNLSFARAVEDMILLGKVIALGALQRDECRGAHYKPEFEIPETSADDPAELRKQAGEWCARFKQQRDQWLKTTVATYSPNGPVMAYEPVDTSLIAPRPRTYGLKGAEIVDQLWKEMEGGSPAGTPQAVGAAH
jgi:succinate dehydrogenase / fumarate reductase flavoprotein subunit